VRLWGLELVGNYRGVLRFDLTERVCVRGLKPQLASDLTLSETVCEASGRVFSLKCRRPISSEVPALVLDRFRGGIDLVSVIKGMFGQIIDHFIEK
jgi:hypothetical protein